MATVKQYAIRLWDVHKTISGKLGLSIEWGSSADRVPALTTDVMLAGLVKVLTDKGLLTDAELNAVFNSIASATFPPLPAVTPMPGDGVTAADPELGA